MTISDWLETLHPRAVLNQELTARDFFLETGYDADWPVHTMQECRGITEPRPDLPDDHRVAYAWEIAQTVSRLYANYDPVISLGFRKHGECLKIINRAIRHLQGVGL